MNKDKVIRISLPQSVYDVLLDFAIQECRHPKEQARYILQKALLGQDKDPRQTHVADNRQAKPL